MRYTHYLVNTLLLLAVPSTSLYSHSPAPSIVEERVGEKLFRWQRSKIKRDFIEAFKVLDCAESSMQKPSPLDSIISYDDILKLLHDLESGELEKTCTTPEDVEALTHFLIYLARQGVLPNQTDEALKLENDIHELLQGDSSFWEYDDSPNDYLLIPAIFYDETDYIQCKSWLKKRLRDVKDFAKRHKKALLIAAGVVAAVAITAGLIAAASAAGAAGAGAAAAGTGGNDHGPSIPSTPDPATLPSVYTALDEHIASLKNEMASGTLFQSFPDDAFSLEEHGRTLGSLIAHDSLNALNDQFYNLGYSRELESSQQPTAPNFAHHEIDRKFHTDYAPLYANTQTGFSTLSLQARGEIALAQGNYDQAVYHFEHLIEQTSTNPIPYLDRGIAHFGLGDYEHSLEDFREFTSHAQKSYPLSVPEFSRGFAKGLPKGIYDSGESLCLFLSDLVIHPIQTSAQMWEALSLLSQLARSEEWSVLSEVLAPEIHKLIKEWDTLPSSERGELASYAFGKYGADILIPGALAKAVSKDLKGARELSLVYRGVETADKTLLLESVASLGTGAKVAEVLEGSQRTVRLGEELGFSPHDMAQLKKTGNLEGTVTQTFDSVLNNPAMRESYELFDRAQKFLKPYKEFMPEARCRELIHQTGIPTFPRPTGIPESFRVRISNRGAGMTYVHPEHTHTSIRVMPGKPHSPFPYQQQPYVNQRVNGKSLDKQGNVVANDSPDAHIPLSEFVYRGKD